MEVITSKSNEKVKYIKSLNDKKFRYEYRAFYLEGIKVVKEVIDLRKAIDIEFIAYSNDILSHISGGAKLIELIQKIDSEGKIKILEIKEDVFKCITDTVNPQGVLAVLKMPDIKLSKMLNTNDNVILLDKVQDSGNIGTIIRTADAFMVKNIICVNGTADVYSPKVVRSTMGSILRVNVKYIDEDEIEKLKKYSHKIVGTSLDANCYIENYDFSKKSIFVFGNEANGIGKYVKDLCDEMIKINMSSNVDSLNVSVAAGIVLYNQFGKLK